MRATFRRAAAGLPLLLALVSPGLAQEPESMEEGFFELFVQRIPNRIPLLTLVDEDGRVLIPLTPVLDYLGIPTSRVGEALVLEWPPEIWRTVVKPDTRTIVQAGDTTTFEAEDWYQWKGETYLGAGPLGQILSARVEVAWSDLVVMISDNLEFPSTKRLDLEARRARERLQGSQFDPDRFSGLPYEPKTGGWAAGWGVSLSDAENTTRGSLRGTLGASLMGGGIEVGGTTLFSEGGDSELTDRFARYSRVFAGSEIIRRIQLGSVLSEGTLAHRLVGFTVTNEPLTTPRFFSEAVVTPAVPSGWEYEVYQGDHLVGVSSTDSPGDIRAPLNYGNTPVKIRMIGPAGQEMEEELVFVVPQGRVPPGSWRYSAGGGRCQDPGCWSYWFGELLRGFSPWLTAGLGADRMVVARGDEGFLPFALLDLSPRPNLGLNLQARGSSYFRTNLNYSAGRRGSYSGGYTNTGEDAGALAGLGWSAHTAASGPFSILGGRWVSARLLLRGREQGKVDSWQGGFSTTIRRTHVAVDFESGLQGRGMTTLRFFHTLGPRLPAALRDASISGSIGTMGNGIDLLELGGSVRTQIGALVNTQLRIRDGVSPVLTVGMTLRSFLGYFQTRSSRGGGTGTFVGADGGLSYSPGVGLMTLPYQSVGRGGVAGTVYQDLDGDGKRSPDEPPLAEADVIVEGRRVTTNRDGHFRAWELMPYEGVQISVDSLSIDPQWTPAPSSILLRPSPNLFNRVDLPVQRTREVMGSVVLAGESPTPLGGVKVEILDESGSVVVEERTFSDGVFYFQRIRPGTYALRVHGPGAGGTVIEEFRVPPGEGGAIEIGPVEIRPTVGGGGNQD